MELKISRKISIVSLSLLLISTSSWAAQGFYLGAGLGPETANFKQQAYFIQPGIVNVIDTTHLSGTGIFGTIFGGYGWNKKKFYLAGEVNANISSVEFKSSNLEFIHSNFANTSYNPA